MSDVFVSVIIVNYNSGVRLEKCLAHLTQQRFRDFDIVVVDNASSDRSHEVAEKTADVRVINAGHNIGFAAANNLAVKEARGAWLAFLNPDAYAKEDWLEKFFEATKRYEGVDAFGSTQLDAADPAIVDGAGDVVHGIGLYYRGGLASSATTLHEDGECFSPCAAAAFYKREVFEALEGFDERFFCYGEDVDLGFRLRHEGGRAIQLKDAVVLHEGSGITGRRSDFSIYHGVRNRLWVYYKNLPAQVFWLCLPVHLGVNLLMLTRSIFTGEGSAYWRGMRDGYAGMRTLKKTKVAQNSNALRHLTWSPLKLLNRASDLR